MRVQQGLEHKILKSPNFKFSSLEFENIFVINVEE